MEAENTVFAAKALTGRPFILRGRLRWAWGPLRQTAPTRWPPPWQGKVARGAPKRLKLQGSVSYSSKVSATPLRADDVSSRAKDKKITVGANLFLFCSKITWRVSLTNFRDNGALS
jgi:hypothetical protein